MWILQNFKEYIFYRRPPEDYFSMKSTRFEKTQNLLILIERKISEIEKNFWNFEKEIFQDSYSNSDLLNVYRTC